MSDQLEDDRKVLDTTLSDGWKLIKDMADEMIREDEAIALDSWGRNPDAFGEKLAIKHSARRAAIQDLMEKIGDRVRILLSKSEK